MGLRLKMRRGETSQKRKGKVLRVRRGYSQNETGTLPLNLRKNLLRASARRLREFWQHIFERLEADDIIKKDVGQNWNITNLGAILFAKRLSDISGSIARKGVRFVHYDGATKADKVVNRHDGALGYTSSVNAFSMSAA